MNWIETYFWLIPVIPLIGFLINGILGEKLNKKMIGLIGCSTVAISFILSVITFLRVRSAGEATNTVFTWINAGALKIDFGLLLDPLSTVMILVVTGVGFLIHIYSVGYMAHEEGYARYFAFLNLFTFSMLVLVMADNLLLMFVGWEGVGLCSYLLIGFYYKEDFAAKAGVKAFVVNRIGDFGFALGLFLTFMGFGTLKYTVLNEKIAALAGGSVTLWAGEIGFSAFCSIVGILLFIGACGKSAQIPLYVWLPDAMAGPTPVSALIHAATMVTAGVYMIARMNLLYIHGIYALIVVGIVGALTAIFAASIGLVQEDIKKILAYSTISQLGYMFIACGVGAFGAAIFHLVTHAFFKALLFLCAGSVIHAMSGDQNIFNMGGLKDRLPVVRWTYLAACLAISGIFPFSGFFSKDEILWKAFSSPVYGYSWLIWLTGFVAAGMTSFYIFRSYYMTFHGSMRMDEETKEKIHRSPSSMTVPLIVLGILSTVGGFIGIPHIIGKSMHIPNLFHHWLEPVMQEGQKFLKSGGPHPGEGIEWTLMIGSVGVALIFWGLAKNWYDSKTLEKPKDFARRLDWVYTPIKDKYYVDEFYNKTLVEPLAGISKFLWRKFDELVIDGFVNGSAKFTRFLGMGLSRLQTGYVRNYVLSIFLGTVLMMIYFLIKVI